MKKIIVLLLAFASFASLQAQERDPKKLQETARTFMRQGDFSNALVVLNRALELDPGNLELLKDLALTHYYKKDLASALGVAKPLAERKDVDVQSYQILGLIYKALEEKKEVDKMYKAALKKFPASGVLYNEYGELLWAKNEFAEAIKNWEKGIESEPSLPGNYYNAAKYYYMSADKVWGLVYGEIFVNMESYTQRTVEIKQLLLDGYKKLYADADLAKNQNMKNEFVAAFIGLYQKHAETVSIGITPETIAAVRTRFILEWMDKYGARFPFRLFEHHNQLLKLGFFDAYNQWIFGAATNLAAYEEWTRSNAEVNKEFLRLQQNRIFKVPGGQYYNKMPN